MKAMVYEGDGVWRRWCMEAMVYEDDGARRRWCTKAMVQGVMVYGGDGA